MTGKSKDRPPSAATGDEKGEQKMPALSDGHRLLSDVLADLDEEDQEMLSEERSRVVGASPRAAK